jgi:hypothetical protein
MTESRKINKKAIVIGLLTDIVLSAASGLMLGVLIAFGIGFGGGELDRYNELITHDPIIAIIMGCVSLICSLIGGYVAARKAKVLPVRHGLFVGISGTLLSILLYSLHPTSLTELKNIVPVLLTTPAALLGGYFRALMVPQELH